MADNSYRLYLSNINKSQEFNIKRNNKNDENFEKKNKISNEVKKFVYEIITEVCPSYKNKYKLKQVAGSIMKKVI